jgi:hypothetical protein
MSRIFVSPREIEATRTLPIQNMSAKVSATWTRTGRTTAGIDMWIPPLLAGGPAARS